MDGAHRRAGALERLPEVTTCLACHHRLELLALRGELELASPLD